MYYAVNDILEFHQAMNRPIGDPRSPDVTVHQELRVKLIEEEFEELKLALSGKDKLGNALTHEQQIIAVADALGDLAVVVTGAAVTWGIDLGSVFAEIHRSNMTKTPGNLREDGKLLKGPRFQPPDLKKVLDQTRKELMRDGVGDDSWWPEPTSKTE